MVRSSSVVLPAPGELVMFSARMSRSASHCRFWSASEVIFCQDLLLQRDGLGLASSGVVGVMVMVVVVGGGRAGGDRRPG